MDHRASEHGLEARIIERFDALVAGTSVPTAALGGRVTMSGHGRAQGMVPAARWGWKLLRSSRDIWQVRRRPLALLLG
jgi:hypothetical protein